MESLGARIKKIRGHLSREAFAKKYGMHRNTIERYEKGTRTVPESFLFQLAECEGVYLNWVQTGEGPMRMDEKKAQTGDVSPVLPAFLPTQPIENITSTKNKTGDVSPVLPQSNEVQELYRKMLGLQERLLSLTEQNADLRLQLKERDLRIRELEKENAGLREERKGAAAVYRAATGDAG